MTEEAFWNKVDTEIIPMMEERKYKYIRYFKEKVDIMKTRNEEVVGREMFHHDWLSFACMFRNLYYDALVDKSMGEFCMIKIGKNPTELVY
jgi:hypothetical protein